jgi:hypothetical protein
MGKRGHTWHCGSGCAQRTCHACGGPHPRLTSTQRLGLVGGGDYLCERVVVAEAETCRVSGCRSGGRRWRSSRANREVLEDGVSCRTNSQVLGVSTVLPCLMSITWWTLVQALVNWLQRSKATRLVHGDDNTKYFQLLANGRYYKTRFYQLDQEEHVTVGEENKKTDITHY